jgi:hypothetical protein
VTESSNSGHSHRVFRMPTRRSVWLYDYDHVKYRTRLQWALSFVAGIVLAAIGCLGVWSIVIGYRSGRGVDTAILALSATCVAMAVIELPAALIYFYRRSRGEVAGYFDYEVEVTDRGQGTPGVHRGPDHH